MSPVTTSAAALTRLRSEEDGATAVEYALIVSLIAIFIIGAVTLLGGSLAGVYNTISGSL